ncbi:sigma-70 family RNA polymerase sigma factor [Streptomyces sp. NPDC005438]|uniref:sigma-70 family RNA polymerase sigma factor n=1 Tax=Streptomyces sp. NPDC005438 TaxID=3156880 RepID=UPI0033BDE9E7
MANETPPRWDRRMRQRLVRGEAAALGELYDLYAPLVHSLATRVLDDNTDADQTTREVFTHVWENPETFDPSDGTLRSWIADLAQQRAVARLRKRHSRLETPSRVEEKVLAASTAARADYIAGSMPASLRAALHLAYFQRQDYRQAATQLGVTEEEARRRLRLGLQLLSTAVPAGPRSTR